VAKQHLETNNIGKWSSYNARYKHLSNFKKSIHLHQKRRSYKI